MLTIKKTSLGDTRTCDYANVTKQQLLDASRTHITDVRQGLLYFIEMLKAAGRRHDYDKISDIDGFHRDFLTGFQQTEWWDNHRRVNRHHLFEADGIPEDVNLIDVLDLIADCVMAGMGRSGEVKYIELPSSLLQKAFQNTVERLKSQVTVIDDSAIPAR